MIDKLDLRVPGNVPFTDDFAHLYAWGRGDKNRFRDSKHYAKTSAWDDCGYEVVLHVDCLMTDKPLHKLEILRTGEKTYEDMCKIAASIFDTNPERLGIMRADLTADIKGVDVDWFKRHTFVKAKQTRREHGSVSPYLQVGKGSAETLYRGVKPNQIRIYDKVAERRMQYAKMLQRFVRDSSGIPDSLEVEPTSFETLYGHGMWDTITRVERQIGGRDVDKMGFSDLRSLQRAATMDPFDKIVFFDVPCFDYTDPTLTTEQVLVREALRTRVREYGLQETLRWLKNREGKNYDRAKKRFATALGVTDNVVGIDAGKLRERFQESARRQLLPRAA